MSNWARDKVLESQTPEILETVLVFGHTCVPDIYIYNCVCEMYVHVCVCVSGSKKLEVKDMTSKKKS